MASAPDAPLGANLVGSGATFRIWAPEARSVAVRGTFNNWSDEPLVKSDDGHWSAFVPGVTEGAEYEFWIVGSGSSGRKRDPYARALTLVPAWPESNCLVTQPQGFPWHDAGFRPPRFHKLVLYQLHVGAYWSTDAHGADRRSARPGRFLDLLFRLDYLVELGVNAVQLLPIQEFPTARSLGYNGTDYFSPEMDYTVAPTDPDFPRYFEKANELLARRGLPRFGPNDLDDQTKQLMAVIDLLHVYGIAVILDVVYNHAGGGFDDASLFFLDRQPTGDNNRSLYFTNQGWAGGLVFAYWRQEVCRFLIDNASLLFTEYHVDGFRFDEVTVIDRFGGWPFLQDLTDTLRDQKPAAMLIAEYWADQSYVLRPRSQLGAGFDGVVASGLRGAVRNAIAEAGRGRNARVELEGVRDALYPAFGAAWRQVQHLENHDIVRINNDSDRQPRISALGNDDSHSWYARSRTRIANGLLLTAPGIPMLFMGQEFLENRYWSDSPGFFIDSLIQWDRLTSDRVMQDHLRFIRELIAIRNEHAALTADGINVFHVHDDNRVLAFQRWVEGSGNDDVVVVASLREETWYSYRLGFPRAGRWREIFNSDVYDNWVNPSVTGNGGSIVASDVPMHGLPASAEIVIPANSILVFAL